MSDFADALNRPAASGRRAAPASRQGRKHVGVYVTPEVAQALRIAAAQENTSVQAIIEQAIASWLESRSPTTPGRT